MSQKASRIVLTINGKRQPTLPGWDVDIGGIESSPVNGDSPEDTGPIDKMTNSELSGDIMFDADTKLASLQGLKGLTAVVTLDTGNEYLVENAWVASAKKFRSGEGKFHLVIQGPPGQEL